MGFFDFIFGPILKPLRDIIKGALQLVEVLIILVTKIPQILEAAFLIFQPHKLINDIIIGLVLGIQTLVNAFLDRLNLSKYFSGVNKSNSKENCKKNKNCYRLTLLNIIMLVICPPIGILMKGGIALWFEILICSILTIYAYYFPGLLFSILVIQH